MRTLLRALALLPLPVLHACGALVGWIAFALSPTYRRRFVGNARHAGLAFSVVRPAVAESGKLVMETPRLWFGGDAPVEWRGAELIDAARATGRGILFLTPHLGCFEVTAQGYARRFGRITVLYRPARKPWLRDLVATARERTNLVAAPTTLAGVKQLLKALKAGEAVGLLPDQVPPRGQGVWAPFFGQPAYTMTLPSRLAQQANAVLLLAWGERLSFGRGYRIHVREWRGAPGSQPEAAAAQLNLRMEGLVRECPEQYLWGYARYKEPRAELAL
ncbi:MAG TPA: lysophospholipid acyltransferase family protein [Ramlibacter sp.]|nr:lysophospholipid acyltransferase family protein [Ramlibacter sp.]